MRIFVTGDLHYGITPKSKLREFTEAIKHTESSVLVILGDIAESIKSPNLFDECLDIFVPLNISIFVIPGNHDLWVRDDKKYGSRELFNIELPKRTKECGCHWLEHENAIIDDVAIVGSMLHYDYSARDKKGVAVFEPEYFHQNRKNIINDGLYFTDIPDDRAFSKEIGDKFKLRLQQAQDDARINKIIVVTHVPCTEYQITRNPHDFSWSVGTAFFGNLTYEKFILSCDKVQHIVSGHSHQGSKHMISVGNRDVNIINLDSDYGKPTGVLLEV